MISCITLFRKKDGITPEALKDLMQGEYAEKCLSVKGLHGYEQNYVFLKELGDAYHEDVTADAFTIERYDTLHEYEEAMKSTEYKIVLAARDAFSCHTESFTCLENVSIPCNITPDCKKKISLLQRTAPKVSFEDYTREWLVIHSGCMIKMPKDIFFGYNQHLVIDRMVSGKHVPYEENPVDGILELYFSDAAAVSNAFKTTPEGQLTVSHRKEFMCGVDPFLVDFKIFLSKSET